MLAPNDAQLFPVRVVGERLDDIRSCMDEVAMHLLDHVGMVEHGFRHESARLHVAAALELEQITLGADHGPLGQPLEETVSLRNVGGHAHFRTHTQGQ